MSGIARIAEERRQHITREGWTPEHDDEHDDGAMAMAAACYAMPSPVRERYISTADNAVQRKMRVALWPWGARWWKPVGDEGEARIEELTKAGALIAAEIDRLERAEGLA